MFVVLTDASGTFNEAVRQAAWTRMDLAGAQLLNWFAVSASCSVTGGMTSQGLGTSFANRDIPAYRNLMTSYMARK